MHTTMLWRCGVFSTATRWSPTRLTWPSVLTALLASSSSGTLEGRIGPGFGDHLRAVVRADLGFIGLDDGIERGGIDVALFGQDRLERAHAQFGLGQFRNGRGHESLMPSRIGEILPRCRGAARPRPGNPVKSRTFALSVRPFSSGPGGRPFSVRGCSARSPAKAQSALRREDVPGWPKISKTTPCKVECGAGWHGCFDRSRKNI